MKVKVTGYVDGMNFYEASKGKPWYPSGWCNWRETFAEYCPGSEVSVRYFTSRYEGGNRERVERQNLHLRAMEEVARAEIIYGSVRERSIKQREWPESECQCGCNKRLVEKMTDVNIAIRLLEDAIDGLFDRAYVVSADVDLIPAIHAALRRAPNARVIALLPPDSVMADAYAKLGPAYPGRSEAKHLDLDKLRRFSDDLPLRWGMRLPEHWREHADKRPLQRESGRKPVRRPALWYEESAGCGSKGASKEPAIARASAPADRGRGV